MIRYYVLDEFFPETARSGDGDGTRKVAFAGRVVAGREGTPHRGFQSSFEIIKGWYANMEWKVRRISRREDGTYGVVKYRVKDAQQWV